MWSQLTNIVTCNVQFLIEVLDSLISFLAASCSILWIQSLYILALFVNSAWSSSDDLVKNLQCNMLRVYILCLEKVFSSSLAVAMIWSRFVCVDATPRWRLPMVSCIALTQRENAELIGFVHAILLPTLGVDSALLHVWCCFLELCFEGDYLLLQVFELVQLIGRLGDVGSFQCRIWQCSHIWQPLVPLLPMPRPIRLCPCLILNSLLSPVLPTMQ